MPAQLGEVDDRGRGYCIRGRRCRHLGQLVPLHESTGMCLSCCPKYGLPGDCDECWGDELDDFDSGDGPAY
jgi:hypothetical protein